MLSTFSPNYQFHIFELECFDSFRVFFVIDENNLFNFFKFTRFNNVNFGLVAKDDTKIAATNITAENVKHHALMSYSKKPIFGGAILDVSEFNCLDAQCENKITVETGSVLTINGTAIDSQDLDVKGLYRTIMKSDKPR